MAALPTGSSKLCSEDGNSQPPLFCIPDFPSLFRPEQQQHRQHRRPESPKPISPDDHQESYYRKLVGNRSVGPALRASASNPTGADNGICAYGVRLPIPLVPRITTPNAVLAIVRSTLPCSRTSMSGASSMCSASGRTSSTFSISPATEIPTTV